MATNLLLGVKDAVVSTVNGLIDGIKYVWNNPLQTIEGVTFFSRALHSGTEENDLLVQMIKVETKIKGLQCRYPERKLIPFAKRDESPAASPQGYY